jgi:hypothetical protein
MFQQVERPGAPWTPNLVAADLEGLASAGANYLNLSIPGPFAVSPPYAEDVESSRRLDEIIRRAADAGLNVVLSFRTGPGRSERDIVKNDSGPLRRELFDNATAETQFTHMWKTVAQRYRGSNRVVGYDLLVEPHAPDGAKPGEQQEFQGRWARIAQGLIKAVRAEDGETPILVSPVDWGTVAGLESWEPLQGERIVYTAHQYVPYEYTHPPEENARPLPFKQAVQNMRERVEAVRLWKERHPLSPVGVNEFGVWHAAERADEFLHEELRLLEAIGVNHAVWIWEVLDPDYDERTFDVKQNSRLLRALEDNWKHNCEREEPPSPP